MYLAQKQEIRAEGIGQELDGRYFAKVHSD